jgi:hypothetical protein
MRYWGRSKREGRITVKPKKLTKSIQACPAGLFWDMKIRNDIHGGFVATLPPGFPVTFIGNDTVKAQVVTH